MRSLNDTKVSVESLALKHTGLSSFTSFRTLKYKYSYLRDLNKIHTYIHTYIYKQNTKLLQKHILNGVIAAYKILTTLSLV